MAITSLLIMAALGALTRLARADRAAQAPVELPVIEAGLRQLLEADVAHARKCRTTRDGFELQTQSSLDPRDLELTHLDSTVGYEVRRFGSASWLLRRQKAAGSKDVCELVCPSVRSATLGGSAGNQTPAAGGASGPGEPMAGDWAGLPPILTVAVGFEGNRGVLSFSFETSQ